MKMDFKELIATLVQESDKDTLERLERNVSRTVKLCGDMNAPFLRGVKSKAEKLGLRVIGESGIAICPTIVDVETSQETPDREFDIDGLLATSEWTPAVTEAIVRIIKYSGLVEQNICIVGRGHVARELPKLLLNRNHTVSVCHSRTNQKAMHEHIYHADIVVLATPDLSFGMRTEAKLVIDVGGVANKLFLSQHTDKVDPRDLGRLTTSILCNRVMRWYR